jgi:hypothetical protein
MVEQIRNIKSLIEKAKKKAEEKKEIILLRESDD